MASGNQTSSGKVSSALDHWCYPTPIENCHRIPWHDKKQLREERVYLAHNPGYSPLLLESQGRAEREQRHGPLFACPWQSFSFILLTTPLLGTIVTHSGLLFLVYINQQLWQFHRYARKSTWSRQFLIKILFPDDSIVSSWQLKLAWMTYLKPIYNFNLIKIRDTIGNNDKKHSCEHKRRWEWLMMFSLKELLRTG